MNSIEAPPLNKEKNILTIKEIEDFKKDGAVILRKKFDTHWIKNLKIGIAKDIKSPSPRFKSHTTKKGIPAYLEDYWTWDRVPEFRFCIQFTCF